MRRTPQAWQVTRRRNLANLDDDLPLQTAGDVGQGVAGIVATGGDAAFGGLIGYNITDDYNPEDGTGSYRFLFDLNGNIYTAAYIVAGETITVNGETLNVGDFLIGKNLTGKADVFWDESAGQLKLRYSKIDQVTVDQYGLSVDKHLAFTEYARTVGSGFIDNFDTNDASYVRITQASGDFSIRHLKTGKKSGQILILQNDDVTSPPFSMTLKNNDITNIGAGYSRIYTLTGVDETRSGYSAAMFIYSSTTNQWFLINYWENSTGGATGGLKAKPYVTIGNDGTLSAERALTGTANQVIITDNGANSTVVLSMPQNLDTAAEVQFGRVGAGVAPGSIYRFFAQNTLTRLAKLKNTAGSAYLLLEDATGSTDQKIRAVGCDNGALLLCKLNDAESGYTIHVTVDTDGNLVIGTAALATNAADGFIYVDSCAGVPTGTPTSYTGRVPMVVDTANLRVYFYIGGTWRYAALT